MNKKDQNLINFYQYKINLNKMFFNSMKLSIWIKRKQKTKMNIIGEKKRRLS